MLLVVRVCLATSALAGSLRRVERACTLLISFATGYLRCGHRLVSALVSFKGLSSCANNSSIDCFSISTFLFSIRFVGASFIQLCVVLVQQVVEIVHDFLAVTHVGSRPLSTVHMNSTSKPLMFGLTSLRLGQHEASVSLDMHFIAIWNIDYHFTERHLRTFHRAEVLCSITLPIDYRLCTRSTNFCSSTPENAAVSMTAVRSFTTLSTMRVSIFFCDEAGSLVTSFPEDRDRSLDRVVVQELSLRLGGILCLLLSLMSLAAAKLESDAAL